MIDLTPLEVRKKKGDFRRAMRGYDPALVDDFLDLVADRLEELVRENMTLHERVSRQDEQVRDYRDRERALTEALVSAQEMREEVRRQAMQEAELAKRSAEQHAEQLRTSAEAEVRQLRSSAQQEASQELASLRQERQREEQAVRELRARREEFLGTYRALLEQELEELGVIARSAGVSFRRAAPQSAAAASEPAAGRSSAVHPSAEAAAPRQMPDSQSAPDAPAVAADGDLDEDDVSEESAFALGASPAEVADMAVEDDEPFAPEPFVEDESAVVSAAYEAESPAVTDPAVEETRTDEAAGGDASEDLYDGVAPDADGDGVPGPIGLGPEPWSNAPGWSVPDLQLIGGEDEGDALDLDFDEELDEDDEEMQTLLRNAAAAGYHLDDSEAPDELLLDEAVNDDDNDDDEPPADDGWLPTLLEDDK